MSYPGNSLGESYTCAEMQSMYSTAPAAWAVYVRAIAKVSFVIFSESNFDLVAQNPARPFGWRCIIRWLHLCCGVIPLFNVCPGYDTKQSNGEAPVLDLWEMWNSPSLPLPPPWPGLVIPQMVLSMGQIEISNHFIVCKQMTDVKLNC